MNERVSPGLRAEDQCDAEGGRYETVWSAPAMVGVLETGSGLRHIDDYNPDSSSVLLGDPTLEGPRQLGS